MPIVLCDARRPESVKRVLIASVTHSLEQRQGMLAAASPQPG